MRNFFKTRNRFHHKLACCRDLSDSRVGTRALVSAILEGKGAEEEVPHNFRIKQGQGAHTNAVRFSVVWVIIISVVCMCVCKASGSHPG